VAGRKDRRRRSTAPRWRIPASGACLVALIAALAWFATGEPGADKPPVFVPTPERTAAAPMADAMT
jgi:hypothetical protein